VLCVATASAESGGKLTGFVAGDVRIFPNTPAFPQQEDRPLSPSLVVQPEYRYKWNDSKDVVTAIPFARLEFDDDHRRHADLREFSWLHVGSAWDLLFGVSKVFWGVTESRHLVDIINQTDFVEDLKEEVKLGQPMLKLAFPRPWGTLTFFLLPYFRERTFPSSQGRLRPALPIDTDNPVFESSLQEWHPDGAIRWTHTLGNVDIGLAHFAGTGREPRLVPAILPPRPPMLVPHYDLIQQTSLDAQVTTGGWLWKLEALTRSGQGRRFAALVAGFEYTFSNVFDTAASVGVLGEYLYDGRSAAAPPTPFDDDFFVGLRLALNDLQNTTVLTSATLDRRTLATFFNLEASRRLSNRWTLELTTRVFINIPPRDVLFSLRRDDYVQIRVARYF
jgi:hypothetical protein